MRTLVARLKVFEERLAKKDAEVRNLNRRSDDRALKVTIAWIMDPAEFKTKWRQTSADVLEGIFVLC